MRIAITMGDPAGIGPEVILKALTDETVAGLADWVIVGDARILAETADRCHISASVFERRILDAKALSGGTAVTPGKIAPGCGAAAVQYVRTATESCLAGKAAAMVTAPLNKEAVAQTGMEFSGHTEYIAQLCGVNESRMLLAGPRLSVVHVSTHISLRQACNLQFDRVLTTIALGDQTMRLLGHATPRIVVCGLNPHAGEHGLFGSEDFEIITPAINEARCRGIQCDGPAPPDTVFLQASRGKYDLVVAMYHDQGHIPMKLLDFDDTVNISIGLPIIRTSVDHGTAFDIAGTDQANPRNMMAAMRMAAAMAKSRLTECPGVV